MIGTKPTDCPIIVRITKNRLSGNYLNTIRLTLDKITFEPNDIWQKDFDEYTTICPTTDYVTWYV